MEFLEREANLQELAVAWQDAKASEGRIALVSGEAGIGKSTLVERFTRQHQGSARVLWGACDALFTPRPLGPLHDMAAQMKGDLSVLLNSDVSNRATLFSTVLAELQTRPTIAVFEDVHWADEATLDLLKYLSRRVTRTSALIVLTYRDDEVGPKHPLRTLLGDMATTSTVRRIPLASLSENAVRVLVGKRAIDSTVLHHQTGGNPFFVTEVIASDSAGFPATVRDAVLARAARLSPSARAILEAAAVISARVEPWLLAEVTGAEAKAADECLAIGVLLTQGDALAFRHELARQTILEVISPHRRIVLNRLVLEALRSSVVTRSDLTRLAHHAEAAGDGEAVLAYAPPAARQASAAGAHREAAALYTLALRFADNLPLAEHASLLEIYSRECNVTERPLEAIAAQRQALEIWHSLNDPLKQGETLAALTIMLRNNGNNAEAEQVSRAAIELLEDLPPSRELALAYRAQATLRLASRDNAQAIKWGEKAVELAEHFEDQNVLAMAHGAVGSAWLFLDYDRGCQYLEDRLAITRSTGRETHVANLYAYLSGCSVELYQFSRAARYLAEGIAYATEHGLEFFQRFMLAWQALSHVHTGFWDDANDIAHSLVAGAVSPAVSRIPALVALGRLATRRGQPQVEPSLSEALDLAAPTDSLPFLGLVHAARAEAAWLASDRERTLEEARAVYDLAVSKQHPWFTGELAFWRWRAGDEVAVPEWMAKPFALHIMGNWRAAADEWERLGCPYEQARALADGDTDAQISALEIFDRLGARPTADDLREKMRAAGLSNIPRGPRLATRENLFGLTDRQVSILRLLCEGLSNAEIAKRLHISPKTVGHHVSAVLAKLDVRSREEAAELARGHPQLN
ncbi:MAG TPA: AAA family ATPase [Anaerolineales bacterium]|nr:AAA family ATPase [Anaerolineales bacterium]